MKRSTDNRQYYIDCLRIIGMIAVIIIHIATVGWVNEDVNSLQWEYANFYDGIARFGVPIFVMISGALFLKSAHTADEMWHNYIKRIVIALLFWSFIYALGLYSTGYGFQKSIQRFVEGESHLWYLFMIAGLYAITPLLRLVIQEKANCVYFLKLSFVFTIVIPTVLKVVPFYISSSWMQVVNSVVNNLHVRFVVGYSFYYVLGYYLDKEHFEQKYKMQNCVIGVLGFVATVLLTSYYSKLNGISNSTFFDYFSFAIMIEAVAVFLFIKQIDFTFLAGKGWLTKSILLLSKCSFGIYLVHPFIIKVIARCSGNEIFYKHIFSVPLLTMLIFIISFVISFCLNRIPIVSKYIV